MVDDCSNTRLSLLTKEASWRANWNIPFGKLFFFTRLFSAVSSFLNRSSGRGGKNKKEIRKYIISSIINIYIYISVQRCIQICCICSKQTNAIISSIRPCVNITIIETFEISREKFISQFFFFFYNTWNIHFEENRTVLIGNNFQK